MTRTKLDSIAPVGKGPARGGKPSGVQYNFGKGSGNEGQRKTCTKDSVDTVIGVGKSAIKKPSVGLNRST